MKAKATANAAALEVLARLDADRRPATRDEQDVLARFSGWGALPYVFHEDTAEWAPLREQVRGLLSAAEWVQARASTINAHYTGNVKQFWPQRDALIWPHLAA